MPDSKVITAIIAAVASCLVALVGALVSIITSIWSYFTTRKNQMDLENIKAQLAERLAERDARRDYEYEARKRLYGEYEPLLFQLVELSEDALHRIYSLARSARNGQITETQGGWMRGPNYYMVSSIYKLLAPIAIFKLMRRRLTFVDLTVDPRVGAQYALAKILYFTFTCDFELAAIKPKIEYQPNIDDWPQLRLAEPRKYWRQGLALGRLDNALDDLVVEENGASRLRTFGEYEALVNERLVDNHLNSYSLTEIFLEFHPNTRPVLWRILLAQAHVHRLIIQRVGCNSCDPLKEMQQLLVIPEQERAPLDWRPVASDIPEGVALEEPFNVTTQFVKHYLKELLQYAGLPTSAAAEPDVC